MLFADENFARTLSTHETLFAMPFMIIGQNLQWVCADHLIHLSIYLSIYLIHLSIKYISHLTYYNDGIQSNK